MPPKLKADDLVEALSDGKVMAALAGILAPLINAPIAEMDKKIDNLISAVHDLKTNYRALQNEVVELRQVNDGLKNQLFVQSGRIDDLENYSRCDNLIIKGLPEQSHAERASSSNLRTDGLPPATSNQSVETTFISFCRESLHVEVSPHDLSTAHRMKAGPKDRVRPVIVRFTNRRIRDEVYRSRKLLKNNRDNIYISEHLTKSTSELFYEARKLLREKKLYSTWTQNGQVLVKFSSDISVKPTLVKSREDLRDRLR